MKPCDPFCKRYRPRPKTLATLSQRFRTALPQVPLPQ